MGRRRSHADGATFFFANALYALMISRIVASPAQPLPISSLNLALAFASSLPRHFCFQSMTTCHVPVELRSHGLGLRIGQSPSQRVA